MLDRRRLPRSTPALQGVPARAILDFLDALADGGPELHSLMVLRHGQVLAEAWWHPYRPDLPHELFSLSKSFTSTAVGFAQAEGLLSVDDLVLDHLGDLAPAQPDPRLARMRLRHLLTMTAGHTVETDPRVFGAPDWVRAFLGLPIEAEPGTEFLYNTPATYVLSFIVQRVTGQRLLDYLGPRLLAPLGIEGATWERSPQGVDAGGFGLSVTTEDIACFGQLYLDDGVWDGRRVLPEGWVAEATRRHTDSHINDIDWAQGYGYQFWRCQPPGVFRGDGAFGQFCVVLPEADAVVATTGGTPDLQGVLDRMWAHLAPALAGGGPHADTVDDAGAEAELAERLAALRLEPPQGAHGGAKASDGLAGRRIELDGAPGGIRALVVGPAGLGTPGATVTLERDGGRTETVAVGAGDWAQGALGSREDPDAPVAVAGAWTAPGEFTAQVRLIKTPYCLSVVAAVPDAGSDGVLRATARLNVSFGDPDLGVVTGRVVG